MKIYGGNEGSRGVETRLHSMRGDAARAPDLSASILSRVAESRPFADQRTLRLRRWGRIVGAAVAVGLTLCAGVVAAQWSQIALGLSPGDARPIGGMVSSAVAEVRAGTKSIKDAPARLAFIVRTNRTSGGRTDPDDAVVVRSLTSNVIVPMGAVLRVTPSLEPTEAEVGFAQRMIAGGQRALGRAERLAASFKTSGFSTGSGGSSVSGPESYADRLGRAVIGTPMGDGGPQ